MKKKYKLYSHLITPNAAGYYTALFLGEGSGNIDSGSIVVSNKTGGFGNLTGYIHPEKKAVFTLLKDKSIFISTDGTQMTLQNVLGKNQLSFIQSFLEFVLKYPIYDMEGDLYEGVDLGKKAYLVTYKYDNGKIGRATMTNSFDSAAKATGKVFASPVTEPYDTTKTAIEDPTAGNITKASIVDSLTAVTIGLAGASAFGEGDAEAEEAAVGVDAAVDAVTDELTEAGPEAGQIVDEGEANIVSKEAKKSIAETLTDYETKDDAEAGKNTINILVENALTKEGVPLTQENIQAASNAVMSKLSKVGINITYEDQDMDFLLDDGSDDIVSGTDKAVSEADKVLNTGVKQVKSITFKPVKAVVGSADVVGATQGAVALANKVGDSVGNYVKKL